MKQVALVNLGENLRADLRKLQTKLNSRQRTLEFRVVDPIPNIGDPDVDGIWYDFENLFVLLRSQEYILRFDFVLGITHEKVTDLKETMGKTKKDYFSLCDGGKVSVITEAMSIWAPPRKDQYRYLAYLVMCELLTNMAHHKLTHEPTRSCLFDDCSDLGTIARGIDRGEICAPCLGKLKECNISDEVITDVRRVLRWCSRNSKWSSFVSTIGNPIFSSVLGVGLGWLLAQFLSAKYFFVVIALMLIVGGLLFAYYQKVSK